jgi:dihydroneopterin aldolase
MDFIFIRDLRVQALIGFHRRERFAAQTLSFDLEIGIANEKVFASDRVADCIDYDKVAARVREVAGGHHYNLVEALADRVARVILEEFNAASAKVSVAKLGVMKDAARVGVSIERRR